jgi:hypothetical protein
LGYFEVTYSKTAKIKKMTNQNYKAAKYTVEIEFARSPGDVFDHVIEVSKWWPEEFEGEGIKLNTPREGHTLLKFTYDGVVLENEMDRLAQVCEMTIKERLYNFITNGKTNNHKIL